MLEVTCRAEMTAFWSRINLPKSGDGKKGGTKAHLDRESKRIVRRRGGSSVPVPTECRECGPARPIGRRLPAVAPRSRCDGRSGRCRVRFLQAAYEGQDCPLPR